MDEKDFLPVLVAIRTSSRDDRGKPEEDTRMLVSGQLAAQKDGAYLLRYTESVEQEDGSVMKADVRLKLEDGHVIMLRKGDFSTTMVFSRGQHFDGTYHTPYGDMAMGIYTTRLLTSLASDRGSVTIDYQLDMNGGFSSMRHLTLEYGAEAKKH